MARLETGQVGTFRGKVGQVVVAKWRDVLVGKKTPTKSGKPGSDEQIDQRSKFGLVTKFFRGLGEVIKLGYQSQKTGMTPINAAVQYHLVNAVTGIFPNYALDYSKIVLSNAINGVEIDGGFAPTAVPAPDCIVNITWQLSDRNYLKATTPDDLLSIIIYSLTKKKFIIYDRVVSRSALKYDVELPRIFVNDVCHGYMFFTSPKGKAVSYSEYLGQFKLLP